MQAAVKVIIVSRSGLPFPNPQGGAEIYALRQALGLARAGVEVVIVGQGALPAGTAGATLIFWDARLSGNTTSRSRAVYYFKVLAFAVVAGIRGSAAIRQAPDIQVIHCHHAATALMLRMLAPRRPLVLTVHDLPFQGSDPVASGFELLVRLGNNLVLERLAISRSDHLVAVSTDVYSRLVNWGIDPRRISEVWPVAMDLNQALDPATSQRLASDAGIHGAFILSVGSLTGRKRMDLLVEAMRYLRPGIDLSCCRAGAPSRAAGTHSSRLWDAGPGASLGCRGCEHTSGASAASGGVGPCVRARRAPHLDNRVRAGGDPGGYCTTSPVQLRATGPTSATWLPVLRLASPRR